jgi:hypothetical protein
LAAVVVVVGCALPSAAAAFSATARTVPGTIAYFGAGDPRTTREIEQRLELLAGPVDEQLVLTVNLEQGQVSPGPLRIEGPGSLGAPQLRSAISASSVTGGRGGCEEPTVSQRTVRHVLRLPAGTRTTVSYVGRLRLTRAPASPKMFVQRWELAPANGAGAGAVTVSPQPVRLAGSRAAKLTLRVGVTGSRRSIGDGERLAVRSRSRLTIGGYAGGARAGDAVTIWRFAPGATTAKPLARVRVNRHGRFKHDWRPTRPGSWDLYATYAGHDGVVEAARSPCGGPRVQVSAAPRSRAVSG